MTVLDGLPHLLLTHCFQVPLCILPLKKKKTGTQIPVEMSRWQLSYMFTWHLLYRRETGNTEMSEKFMGNKERSGATDKQGRWQRNSLRQGGGRRK